MPEPAYTFIDPVANGALLNAAMTEQSSIPLVDSEAGKTGVVVGAATATLEESSGQVQLGALQLRVARAPGSADQPVTIQAEVLPAAEAQALSRWAWPSAWR